MYYLFHYVRFVHQLLVVTITNDPLMPLLAYKEYDPVTSHRNTLAVEAPDPQMPFQWTFIHTSTHAFDPKQRLQQSSLALLGF
jgi:hypothetical protein